MVSNNFAKATFHPTVDRKPTQIQNYQVWYWKRCKTRSPKDLLLELGKLILPINQKFGYHFEASQQAKKKISLGRNFFENIFFSTIGVSLQRKQHPLHFEARIHCF
jgi:hypothetical protein